MTDNWIIAICGMAGAGKSECRKVLEKLGFEYVHLGVTEEALRRYGKTNEELERGLRSEMREQYGMGGMAVLALPKINEILAKGNPVVIDNMYSWSEYKIFKDEFTDKFISIAVHASPKLRYSRLAVRNERPLTLDEAIIRDYSEIERIEKGGPIAMADFHIVNNHKLVDIVQEVESILRELKILQSPEQ